MLDLSKVNDKLYEIKMIEGNVLHIRRPSQYFLQRIIEVRDKAEEAIDTLYDIVLSIFNNNVDNKVYDKEYVSQFDIGTIATILEDYIVFTSEQLGEL